MHLKKILILSLAIIAFSISLWAKKWKSNDYQKYSYSQFIQLNNVNQIIDTRAPNIRLLNAVIFYETNRQRRLHSRSEFKHSVALEKAAYGHSKDMVKYRFFSHTSRVRSKRTMKMRINQQGIVNAYMAENIADNYIMNHPAGVPYYIRSDGYYYQGKKIRNRTYLEMGRKFVTQWMNSPGHRRNILNPRGRYLGCGVYPYMRRGKLRFKATQNFASKDVK